MLDIKYQYQFLKFCIGIIASRDEHSMKNNKIGLFINTYKTAGKLYLTLGDFVKAYNSIKDTDFTAEQLEKYLLLL